MNTPTRLFTMFAALALTAAPAAKAQAVVSNVHASQRAGAKLVDIDYDITGIATPVAVALEISTDGGTTWAVPSVTAMGAIGASVTPSRNLRITWNAGADWNNQRSSLTLFRIKMDDLLPDSAVFARIPSGIFTMGDTIDGDSDAPPHSVNVSAFYIQKKGVTKADWDAVRAWGMTHGYTDIAVGAGKASTHPVQSLTWYDAVKWCNAKSEKEGLTPSYYTDVAQTVVYRMGNTDVANTMVKWDAKGYRLPTDAEREKAARGGLSGKRFPWGDTIMHSQANYSANRGYSYDVSPTQGYHPTYAVNGAPYTSPVGSFVANGYGIFDMTGNVAEMTWDWYDLSYYGVSPVTDPRGPNAGSNRGLRGGSWHSEAYNGRNSRRDMRVPGSVYYGIGFRAVRTSVVTVDSPIITVDTNNFDLTIIPLHGTVSGAGSYAWNSTAAVTVVADPGYAFTGWSGDASGSANPLSVLMDANKTITANFVANLPPVFAGYSISTPFQTAATIPLSKLLFKASDPDGDSITVSAAGPASGHGGTAVLQSTGILYAPAEGFAGTDSFSVGITDAHGAVTTGAVTVTVGAAATSGGVTANPPKLTVLSAGNIGLKFQGIPGRNYQIQRSTDMITWSTITTVTANSVGAMTFTDESPPKPNAFYRLALP